MISVVKELNSILYHEIDAACNHIVSQPLDQIIHDEIVQETNQLYHVKSQISEELISDFVPHRKHRI